MAAYNCGPVNVEKAVERTGYADFWELRRLGALPNVLCKLSGLTTEAAPERRTPEHLLPFLRHAVEVFGPARCMFGSDWPVLTLATTYGQWLDLVLTAIDPLPGDERDQVMRRTAHRASFKILTSPGLSSTKRIRTIRPCPELSILSRSLRKRMLVRASTRPRWHPENA